MASREEQETRAALGNGVAAFHHGPLNSDSSNYI